jgi:hypothetical protein
MRVGGVELPDAVLRSLMHKASVSCNPFSVTWLDRTVMSADQDRRLHRAEKCPFIQLAGGRWQLATLDPDYTLRVTSFGSLSRPVQGTLLRAAERCAPLAPEIIREISYRPEAVVRPGEDPWDACDGDWVLLLRGWVAILSVTGQPKRDGPVPSTGLPTINERLPPVRLYPEPTEPDHTDAVASYLGFTEPRAEAKWRSRRLPLAHYFAELITNVPGGRPKEIKQVAIDLCLDSPRRVATICDTLYPKIWGARTSMAARDTDRAQLFRYLMDHNVLRREDVMAAQGIAGDNHHSGESARTAELFRQGRRR